MTDTKRVRATVTDTAGFFALARAAKGRNRSVHLNRLLKAIDPEGRHVLAFQVLHNDVEWRTQWMVKLRGDDEPCVLWLDVPLDALDKHTSIIEFDVPEA